jgi:hypothetical protein
VGRVGKPVHFFHGLLDKKALVDDLCLVVFRCGRMFHSESSYFPSSVCDCPTQCALVCYSGES